MNDNFLPRVTGRVFNTPLLITESKLSEILWVLNSRVGVPESAQMEPSLESRRRGQSPSIESGVGIVPIHGTIVHRVSGLDAMSGLVSYPDIESAFLQMRDSKETNTILLDIDSPGGEAAALFDLVDLIYNSRGQKRIVAVSNEMALSAAYAIYSAAGERYLSRTAKLGSIGVLALHIDQTARDEKDGYKYTAVYAGAKKTELSSHVELSDSARTDMQSKVDSVYDLFTATVSRNLGLTQDEIKSQEASIYMGPDAVKFGLADEVLSYEQSFNKSKGVVKTMSVNQGSESTSTPTPIPDEQQNLEKSNADQTDILKNERARITEIMDMCETMGATTMANHLISEGYTVENAKRAINDHLAAQSKQEEINSQQTQTQNTKNFLIEDADARLKSAGQTGPLV